MAAVALLTAAAEPSGFYDDGLGRFLISPGFGGVAVLIGGALAFFAARRSSADTRAKTAADAEVARQERWWATLSWVYDRLTALRDRERLTTDIALVLFDRLLDEAHTDLEIAAVEALIDALSDDTGQSEAR